MTGKHILKKKDATSLKTLYYWNLKLHYFRCFLILNSHLRLNQLQKGKRIEMRV